VDAASYWKHLFQQSQFEINQLRGEIATLTREYKDLEARTPIPLKRKAESETVLPRRMTRKMTARARESSSIDSLILNNSEMTRGGKNEVLLYHIYAIRQSILVVPLDQTAIAAHFFHSANQLRLQLGPICNALASLSPSQLQTYKSDNAYKEEDVFVDIRALIRAFGMILQLTLHISNSPGGEINFGAFLSESTLVFQNLLEHISSMCTKGVVRANESFNEQEVSSAIREPLVEILIKIFCNLIGFLEPCSTLQVDLLEGIACVVLDRVADLLYIQTFGHKRTTSIGQEIEADQKTFAMDGKTRGKSVINAALESKYIYRILKSLMAVAPGFHRSGSPRIKSASAKLGSKRATRFTAELKSRFQNTLVRSIWRVNNDSTPLAECLSKPVLTMPLPMIPKDHYSVEDSEWFASEVWKLVGWEILGERDYARIIAQGPAIKK
jgi:hypothetical protein